MPSPKKAYVSDNKTTIICPVCNASKTISVLHFRERHHTVDVRCNCGHSFPLLIEFRRYCRKETFLPGDYNLQTPANIEAGHTRVIDLSIQGACFEVQGHHNISPGMEGELVFTLDDKKQTILFRKVVIRDVRGSRIGCEFSDSNPPSKELGFYMMPDEK